MVGIHGSVMEEQHPPPIRRSSLKDYLKMYTGSLEINKEIQFEDIDAYLT
jgi:hypothetical protein